MKDWYTAYLESKKSDININLKVDIDTFWLGFSILVLAFAIAGKL